MAEEHALSEAEVRILIGAMERDFETKAELAELELRYEQERAELLSRVKETHSARHNTFRGVVEAHGLDPEQWHADLGREAIVPIVEITSTASAEEAAHHMPGPPLSRDDMESRRAGAVTIRTREES